MYMPLQTLDTLSVTRVGGTAVAAQNCRTGKLQLQEGCITSSLKMPLCFGAKTEDLLPSTNPYYPLVPRLAFEPKSCKDLRCASKISLLLNFESYPLVFAHPLR